jgi:hypothetical protein
VRGDAALPSGYRAFVATSASPTPLRRPSFARSFPPHPALDALVAAFARGDYAEVRAHAPRLIESAETPEVRQGARTLLERTKPDPLAVRLLWLAAALLVTLAAYWIANGKAPAPAPPIERSPLRGLGRAP